MTILRTCSDLRVRAGSKRWHQYRLTGIGASEIATALGIAPPTWGSPYSLYMRKRGELQEDRDNAAMQWGNDLETAILKRFLKCHPQYREGVCLTGRLYRSTERPWQLATPDAVVFDRRRGFYGDHNDTWVREHGYPVVVQVKTASKSWEWGEEGSDQIPVYYRAQVLQEMDVVGARTAWVPVLINGRDYREYRVDIDEGDINILRIRGREFWSRVQKGDPPPVDSSPATTRALNGTRLDVEAHTQVDHDLIRKIQRAKRLETRTKQLRARLENELRFQLASSGAAVAMTGSDVVATLKSFPTRRVDLDALRAGHPEVAELYTNQESQTRLHVTQRKL